MRFGLCLCVLVMLLGVSWCKDDKKARGYQYKNDLEEDLLNMSTVDEEKDDHDPAGTWLRFVKRSDKQRQTKKESKKKKSKNKLPGLRGPRGPAGPQGPPGPAGAVVTKEVLMEEFRQMVREAAEIRAQQLLAARCPSCRMHSLNDSTLFASYLWDDELTIVPVIKAGFHSQIKEDTSILKKEFVELAHYERPFGDGAFGRGNAFDAKTGRFTAPVDGIYQFTTSLHIGIPRSKKKRKMNRRENIRAFVCINSLCEKNTSLSFISGLESNSKIFTLHVSGLLQLKAKQHASVFVENSSKTTVIVRSGSDFTGVLSGV